MAALEEYEEHFKSKLEMFEQELEDISSLQLYLQNSNDKIEMTVNEKKKSLIYRRGNKELAQWSEEIWEELEFDPAVFCIRPIQDCC